MGSQDIKANRQASPVSMAGLSCNVCKCRRCSQSPIRAGDGGQTPRFESLGFSSRHRSQEMGSPAAVSSLPRGPVEPASSRITRGEGAPEISPKLYHSKLGTNTPPPISILLWRRVF